MAHDERSDIHQPAVPCPSKRARRHFEFLPGALDQFLLGGSLIASLCIEHPRILRETFAEPLVSIGAPEHHVAPPLVRSLMRDEGICAGVGPIGARDHDGSWKTLPEVEGMVHSPKKRIRILAEHLAKE